MIIEKLKILFQLLKQRFLQQRQKKNRTQTLSEEDIYSLDGYQLKNLLDKNIHFDFFQLDSFNEGSGSFLQKNQDILNKAEVKNQLKKAKLKTKEEILFQLKTEDFQKPIVLICQTGSDSKKLSQELRVKGFFNVYFLRKGLQSLTEGF